ncbi:MAG: NAD-dependent epimerase/dehydratase family protein [Anaerolineales bacterium]|nr:NAD-dependent epimerase/dehydratase family protein [Anaerolineales bacterium]
MSQVHVVFGTGPLGRSVMQELLARGRTVRMLSHSGTMAETPAGVQVAAADLYDPASVRRMVQDAAVAYQCSQPKYHEWPQKFPPLQAAILEGLTGTSTRLVIAENLYMYGDTDGHPLTEDLPFAAHTRKGKVRAAMSQAALAAHQAGNVRVAIGRGSDFFGPWALNSSHGDRVFYPALAGKTASFGGRLDQPHTATYIGDFGKGLVILGEREDALGQAWHVPSDRPSITQGEFAQLVCEQLGIPPRSSAISKRMMRLAGLFIPGAREAVEMMYEFEKPFIVDSSKFEKTFAVRPTPLAQAIEATLAWYRSHPKN